MDFPPPDDAAFVERCLREIQVADDEARREAGLPLRVWFNHPAREPEIVVELREPEPEIVVTVREPVAASTPEPEPAPSFRLRWHVQSRWCRLMPFPVVHPVWQQARHCKGCGCLLDWLTEGCQNCEMRHRMRLVGRVDRICRMIEEAFS